MNEAEKYNKWLDSLAAGDQLSFYRSRVTKVPYTVTVERIDPLGIYLSNGKVYPSRKQKFYVKASFKITPLKKEK